jgi:hypothetical protein
VPIEPEKRASVAASIARSVFHLAHRPANRFIGADDHVVPPKERSYHARMAEEMEALGFSRLAFFTQRDPERAAADRSVHAVYLDADGAVFAVVAYLQPKARIGLLSQLRLWLQGRLPRPKHFLEFGTRLADGSAFGTSNSGGGNPFSAPANHDDLQMPKDTEPVVQLATHRRRVAARLAEMPATAPKILKSVDDYLRHGEVEREERSRYRREIDYVTDEELRGLCKEHYDELHELIRAELRRLDAESGTTTGTPKQAHDGAERP